MVSVIVSLKNGTDTGAKQSSGIGANNIKGILKNGTDTGAEPSKKDYPAGVHGYVPDSLGRMHPIDEFGFRIRKSARPKGFIPESWGKLNPAAKRRILDELAKEPALVATVPPADSWSWKEAQRCVEAIQMDLDLWGGRWSPKNANGGI